MPLATLPGVALGGREHGQEGQSPNAAGPGYGSEQHYAQPAQAAGFDEVAVAGANRVAVDPARLDLGAPTPLDRIVKANHNRPRRGQHGDEQQQQPVCDSARASTAGTLVGMAQAFL